MNPEIELFIAEDAEAQRRRDSMCLDYHPNGFSPRLRASAISAFNKILSEVHCGE